MGQPDIVASRTIRGMSAPSAPASSHATLTGKLPAKHLIIPFAHTGGDGEPPLATLPAAAQLPHLRTLLATAAWQRLFTVPLASLTPPHEWALAHARGLPTGCPHLDDAASLHIARTPTGHAPVELPANRSLPWAAWDAAHLLPTPQTPAAWFTPCHQEIGAHHVSLLPPDRLGLSETHSRALMAALAPLAMEDGIQLTWVAADRWLATGDMLAPVQAASLDRVAGHSIGPWLQTLPPMLRRLQSEAQMLFYTHAAHDERVANREVPVNAIWVSGAGAQPTPKPSNPASIPPSTGEDAVTMVSTLRDAALAGDATSWQQAWVDTDLRVLPAWLARATAGETLHVHLCGELGWLHLCLMPQPLWPRLARRISNFFGTHRFIDGISSL